MLEDIIDFVFKWIICFPISVTRKNKSKFYRFLGYLLWIPWVVAFMMPFCVILTVVGICMMVENLKVTY